MSFDFCKFSPKMEVDTLMHWVIYVSGDFDDTHPRFPRRFPRKPLWQAHLGLGAQPPPHRPHRQPRAAPGRRLRPQGGIPAPVPHWDAATSRVPLTGQGVLWTLFALGWTLSTHLQSLKLPWPKHTNVPPAVGKGMGDLSAAQV